jgi:hypothetical protein
MTIRHQSSSETAHGPPGALWSIFDFCFLLSAFQNFSISAFQLFGNTPSQ